MFRNKGLGTGRGLMQNLGILSTQLDLQNGSQIPLNPGHTSVKQEASFQAIHFSRCGPYSALI